MSGNVSLKTSLYYSLKTGTQFARFAISLRNGGGIKTTDDSRTKYNEYDDREQVDYFNKSRQCLVNGRLQTWTFMEIRQRYLEYLYGEIPEGTASILEVGCGNCINLYNLKKAYPDIELTGIDIAQNRIDVAKKNFGDALNGVNLMAPISITERTLFEDNQFDLVFSMHCLEQIAYDCRAAVAEMCRIGKKVVMIEPVYENGNAAQRLYLTAQDHNRVLFRSIKELGLKPKRCESLSIQSNPLNQSSIIVLPECNNI